MPCGMMIKHPTRFFCILPTKEQVLKQYPERREYRTLTNKQTGEKEIHEIKSEYYLIIY